MWVFNALEIFYRISEHSQIPLPANITDKVSGWKEKNNNII